METLEQPRLVIDEQGTRRRPVFVVDPSTRALRQDDPFSEGTRFTRADFPSAAVDEAPAPETPDRDSAASRRAQKSRHDTIRLGVGGRV